MVNAEKLSLVERKLKKMRKDHYSFMVNLGLTQKKLARLEGELKERNFLITRLQIGAKAKIRGKKKQKRRPEEVKRRQQYKTCVRECFYGFV